MLYKISFNFPNTFLGDLFDMLLPMLSIYQEYVRNHHYSLQVLTECKSNTNFATVLKRLEAKPACQGRSLETFLTYPMHQIPRYIITLHELLAHTPHDHVERKSLQNARQQLEDLSRQMHDEVSETENLRKNLAVERMIVEGCDILLDVNQVFVRQGERCLDVGWGGEKAFCLESDKPARDAVRMRLYAVKLYVPLQEAWCKCRPVVDEYAAAWPPLKASVMQCGNVSSSRTT